MTAKLVEPFAPARLGKGFRWLLASALFSNLGDGIALAAGPLLVASQTDDAFLVAMAYFAQVTPPLLFSIWAGAAADRLDRRMIAILLNAARALILAILAVAIATGVVNIALVLFALFLLSTGETFADIAEGSLLPRLVPREHLTTANARMSGAFLGVNQLIAPPIGAFLFVAGSAIPFAANAICFVLGAVLISRLAKDIGKTRRASGASAVQDGSEAEAAENPAPQAQGVLRDIGEGLRWLAKHPAMRTLVITIVAFNVTYGAAWSVLVLYVRDHLGMGEIGFGIVTAASAIGGILGTLGYDALTRRFSLGNLMRAGLIIETLTHLLLALTRVPAIALVVFFVFGAHAFVWGTTSRTIRQRSVPVELQGRVGSVYMIGVYGGMLLGAPIGGMLARGWGLTAPFWFGFVGSAVLVVVMWRAFAHLADDSEPTAAV
jgi:MFS family permease